MKTVALYFIGLLMSASAFASDFPLSQVMSSSTCYAWWTQRQYILTCINKRGDVTVDKAEVIPATVATITPYMESMKLIQQMRELGFMVTSQDSVFYFFK